MSAEPDEKLWEVENEAAEADRLLRISGPLPRYVEQFLKRVVDASHS